MPGGINRRNDEMVNLLSADFRRLYSPSHAFADSVAMFMTLPGLIGFWPGSGMGTAGLLNDYSGNGLQMTNNNDADFSGESSSLIPWVELNGTTQYFSRADEAILDVAGNEAYVATAIQGLTLGGWFYFDADSTTQGLLSKYVSTGNQRSYQLYRSSSNVVNFEVSVNGITGSGIVGGDSPLLTSGAWYFVAGRWIPSTPFTAWVNNVPSVSGGNGPAAPLFNSTSAFELGRTNAGNYLNGRASLCFLCASALPDVYMTTLYEFSRAMYNR